MDSTKSGVFIIESLSLSDESDGRTEGRMLQEMLRLLEIRSEYRYIRTLRELAVMAEGFRKEPSFRYLHLSCHGNKSGVGLTLDTVPFDELGKALGKLEKRRLFISACSACNDRLADSLRPTSLLSVIGPSMNISFDDAAIFYASFYHIMFNTNRKNMKNDQVRITLEKLTELFEVGISAYFRVESGQYRRRSYPTPPAEQASRDSDLTR